MTEHSNIGLIERAGRYTFSAILLAAILQFSFIPPWLALIAAYVVLTAIIGREPFYGFFTFVKARIRQPKAIKGPVANF